MMKVTPHNNVICILAGITLLALLWSKKVHSFNHIYGDNERSWGICPNRTALEQSSKGSGGMLSVKPTTEHTKQKWKLWPNVIGERELQNGETVVGLEFAMDVIWKNQHPEDCSKARFLMSSGAGSGFGSEIHIESGWFARALDLGRVFIVNPDKLHSGSGHFVDNDFCKKQGKTNLECYYQPLTHCTWEDALGGKSSRDIPNYHPRMYTNEGGSEFQDRSIKIGSSYNPHTPVIFKELLDCSHVNKGRTDHWWQSINTAYMLRPNDNLLQRFAEHRSDPTLHDFDHNKERCISVKIRRGDKHTEMEMIEDETEFFMAAQMLFDRLKAEGDHIALSQKQPVMFVESEDPDVMESAKKWSAEHGWKMVYADIYDRRKESTTWMNKTEMVEAQRAHTFIRNPDEYFLILLTIDYHLRCSGFVCTHRSNACRIIDELRMSVADKANRAYLNMKPCKAGETPPCFTEII